LIGALERKRKKKRGAERKDNYNSKGGGERHPRKVDYKANRQRKRLT